MNAGAYLAGIAALAVGALTFYSVFIFVLGEVALIYAVSEGYLTGDDELDCGAYGAYATICWVAEAGACAFTG
jgi:hypothetical protein